MSDLSEKTRAYHLFRAVTSTLMIDGDRNVTKFQRVFFNEALEFFNIRRKKKTEWELINNGTKNLSTSEVEALIVYLQQTWESKKTIKFKETVNINDNNSDTYYYSKSIENFSEKTEIFNSVLKYFYEIHNIPHERIQELLENRRRQIPITEDNRYQVILGDEVTEKDIDDAIELDFDGYEGENTYIGIKETCYKWYRRNPFIYFMIKDIHTQKIVGYINAMPVTDELYEALKQDELDDINIPHKSILRYTASGQYNLYFASIVVKPSLKNHSRLARKLVDAVCDFFIEKANDNIIIKRMLAKEVSTDGKMLCLNMGMKSRNNDSIFEVSMYPPEFNGKKAAYRKLFDCYQNHYDEHQND